ncbi:MAG: hypothetical protein R6W48_06960 [Gaiellaceae bacterium]
MAAIDRALPEWDFDELHAVNLPCSPERALEAVLELPAAPDSIVRLFFRLRGLRDGPPLGTALRSMGFTVLEQTETEVAAGAAGTPWRRSGGLRPFADAGPGTVRMAIDFRAEPTAGGCRLSTETRVQAMDADALRAFRRYWRVVGPFSALIRRRWLAGVRRAVDP